MDEWKRPHQSITDWDSTDEGWGSPMLGAVHWAVNSGPVSQCGSVTCLARTWPALLEFFTSKPPSYCDEHQTNPKVEDTGRLNDLSQLAQWVFTFSSSLSPIPSLSRFTLSPLLSLRHTVTNAVIHIPGCDRVSLVPWICPSLWNGCLCSECKLSSEQRRQHRVACLLITLRKPGDREVIPLTSIP